MDRFKSTEDIINYVATLHPKNSETIVLIMVTKSLGFVAIYEGDDATYEKGYTFIDDEDGWIFADNEYANIACKGFLDYIDAIDEVLNMIDDEESKFDNNINENDNIFNPFE